MKIINFILSIPSIPIAFILAVYFVVKDLREKGLVEFLTESDDDSIAICKRFCEKYYIKQVLLAVDTIGWFYILKYFFL